jgi:ubiquinone/menaquinone biosynthesis C-methylase UbiE
MQINNLMNSNKKVAEFWSNHHYSTDNDIYNFLPARKYFSNLVTLESSNNETKDWLEIWFRNKYLNGKFPVENCLSLCCGHGERDIRIAELGYFKNCLSLDISEGALNIAKKNANDLGLSNINYQVADLNTFILPENTFDLVYVGAGMHHILNLDHLVNQIYKSLKTGGIFFCDEYVGPNYSNLTNRHREIINAIIHLIPKELKNAVETNFIPGWIKKNNLFLLIYLIINIGKIDYNNINININNFKGLKKTVFKYFTKVNNYFSKFRKSENKKFIFGKVFDIYPENIKKGDPSEGVRASEIIPILKNVFPSTEVYYYNGSLLAYVLDTKFFKNFNNNNHYHKQLFDFITNYEKFLIESREIPPIHAAIISTKK